MFGRRREPTTIPDHIRSRVEGEEATGTVFFRGPAEVLGWELKMTRDGSVVYVRRVSVGESGMESQAYKLTAVEDWEVRRSKLVVTGQFLFDRDEWLWGIRPSRARPVRKRLSAPLPLENAEVLKQALDSRRVVPTARTSRGEIATGFVSDEVMGPVAGVAMAIPSIPVSLAGGLMNANVPGKLVGFEKSGMVHHPIYHYTGPDGLRRVAVDRSTVLEESVDECTAARYIGGQLPVNVRVRCRRSDPSVSRCLL